MAVQAQWDTMMWWMSRESIRSLGSLSTSRELDIEKTEDDDGNIKSQAVRMKLDDLDITYKAARVGGVDPRSEFNEWYWRIGSGIHAPFYINGNQWLGQEYMLMKAEYDCEVFDANGVMQSCEIHLTFREYRTKGQYLDDMSHNVSPTPGVREYRGNERDSALRVEASEMAKRRGQTL